MMEVMKTIKCVWEFRAANLYMDPEGSFSIAGFKDIIAQRKAEIHEEEENKAREEEQKQKEISITQAVQQQAEMQFQSKLADPTFLANMLQNPQVQAVFQHLMNAANQGQVQGNQQGAMEL